MVHFICLGFIYEVRWPWPLTLTSDLLTLKLYLDILIAIDNWHVNFEFEVSVPFHSWFTLFAIGWPVTLKFLTFCLICWSLKLVWCSFRVLRPISCLSIMRPCHLDLWPLTSKADPRVTRDAANVPVYFEFSRLAFSSFRQTLATDRRTGCST